MLNKLCEEISAHNYECTFFKVCLYSFIKIPLLWHVEVKALWKTVSTFFSRKTLEEIKMTWTELFYLFIHFLILFQNDVGLSDFMFGAFYLFYYTYYFFHNVSLFFSRLP